MHAEVEIARFGDRPSLLAKNRGKQKQKLWEDEVTTPHAKIAGAGDP
jgi:hypothetical protein